jgi:phosphonoacetaldehyde hydrolase
MYRYIRRYTGPLQAAILDWSGTTADKYVIAPAVVFKEVFENHGVPITMKESRLPMGLRKDLHIKAITEIPEVKERWKEKHGNYPTQACVDKMFEDFVPLQLSNLGTYSGLIPGTREAVKRLQLEFGLKIGLTTGFTRPMVDVLLIDAASQGFKPDCTVAGDEVENGARPKPFMVYKNLDKLDVQPIQAVVKVDDTVGGIGEGLAAGCWTVGVSRYSNYMDIDSELHASKLSDEEMERRHDKSKEILRNTGAHYVIDTIVDLPKVVSDINLKLKRGLTPQDF